MHQIRFKLFGAVYKVALYLRKIKAENAPDTLQALWRRVKSCSLFKKNKSGEKRKIRRMNTFDVYKKGTRKSMNTSSYPLKKTIKADNEGNTPYEHF